MINISRFCINIILIILKIVHKQELATIIKNLNLEMVIVSVMKVGMIAIMIDKGLSFLLGQINL